MKIKKALIVISVLAIIAAASLAQETAEGVLAKAKQASGGPAWDKVTSVHTKFAIAAGGLQGTGESWEDVRAGRSLQSFQLGPYSGAEGFDGQTAWTQDPSKHAHAEEGDDAKAAAANDAYRRTMAYWYAERWGGQVEYAGPKEDGGRKFQVLGITPRGGRPFELWLDGRTWLPDRQVEKRNQETRTTYFSDYRDVSGLKVPFSSRSTNGEVRYDQVTTVLGIEWNAPLDERMFRMPQPPPPDFVIAGGKSATTVPFELLNNHIYVDVALNGKGPFRLLCDTGGQNVVTPGLALELGLKVEGAIQGQGSGERSEDVGLTKVEAIRIGEATLANQVFAVFDFSALSKVEGLPLRGLVGYEVFKRFVVTIDYERRRLTLTLPESFQYSGAGTAVPFKFNGQAPQVEGEIDGLPGKFDLDTGSRSCLTILAPFAERHDLKAVYQPKVEAITGWGVGGPSRGLMTRAKVLKLGSVAVSGPLTELSLQKKGSFTDPYVAGNVGGGILKRFNIIFDYSRQRLIFERNENDAKPDDYDRAGLWLNLSGGAFRVMFVLPGGPAAEAGIKVGDHVLSVGGRTPAELSLAEAREIFKSKPGTVVRLRVESGGKVRELAITLKELI